MARTQYCAKGDCANPSETSPRSQNKVLNVAEPPRAYYALRCGAREQWQGSNQWTNKDRRARSAGACASPDLAVYTAARLDQSGNSLRVAKVPTGPFGGAILRDRHVSFGQLGFFSNHDFDLGDGIRLRPMVGKPIRAGRLAFGFYPRLFHRPADRP